MSGLTLPLSTLAIFAMFVLTAQAESEFNGYCLTSGGHDQDSGTQSLNPGDKDACYHQCKAVPQATGCEWYKDGLCIYHTMDVATGNGQSDHKCWVFNSSPTEPELNGYCLTSGGHDQDSGTQSLNPGDKDACYHQCKAVPQATGCEWYKDGLCIYHTLDVATGNGQSDHKCWVFNSSPTNNTTEPEAPALVIADTEIANPQNSPQHGDICVGRPCGAPCYGRYYGLICDGEGSCVGQTTNPCAQQGCGNKACGDHCMLQDILDNVERVGTCDGMGICNLWTAVHC